jgi:hypothetical protein
MDLLTSSGRGIFLLVETELVCGGNISLVVAEPFVGQQLKGRFSSGLFQQDHYQTVGGISQHIPSDISSELPNNCNRNNTIAATVFFCEGCLIFVWSPYILL